MHASDIIAYTFDGAIYCVDCATNPPECECEADECDENGLCQENCHGNGPSPVFGDNAAECAGDVCDVCGVPIVDD